MNDFEFIRGRDWQKMTPEEQEEYIEEAFQYWRQRGFPHYQLTSSQIRKRFCQLASTDASKVFLPGNELQASTVGVGLANYYHPQMWAVEFARHRTPLQCFNDDDLLKGCIRRSLKLNPNRKGASPSVLRDMLRTYRHTRRVSNFRPAVAKAIYEEYSKPRACVLDFSAGYGGRMLACLTLERHYVGYDPCHLQIVGLRQMYRSLNDLGLPRASTELHQVCAEDAMPEEPSAKYDLVFTSPPYFDLEKYSDDDSQSYVRYPEYGQWKESFLGVVIGESHRLLKPNGFLVLNVADIDSAPIATDVMRCASKLFKPIRTHLLRMNVLPFNKRRNGASPYRHEPVFVFKKER